MNTVILTEVKVQSINAVALTDRYSNQLRGDTIRYSSVYVFDNAHDEIPETMFPMEE